jgi:hypothetical protein
MSNEVHTTGQYESRGKKKIYAARYKTTQLPISPETFPQTSKSSKIAAIDYYISEKHKLKSGTELEKHEDEFLKDVEESKVGHLNEKDSDELEDKNFHTALHILRKHKLAHYPEKIGYD